MTTTTKAMATPLPHDLSSRDIRPIKNWHEWLARWQSTSLFQEMLGLLHVGFDVPLDRLEYAEPEYNSTDRVEFYFNIADGYDDGHFHSEIKESHKKERHWVGYDKLGNRRYVGEGKLRQEIAQKAFAVLCVQFFKPEVMGVERDYRTFESRWKERLQSDRLFRLVQDFFKPYQKYKTNPPSIKIRNLSGLGESMSHHEKLAVEFLLAFINFIWEWEWEECGGSLAVTQYEQRRIDEAKIWSIEVLAYLRKIEILRKWMPRIDKDSLSKLKEIALRHQLWGHRHPVLKDRPVKSLKEACFIGSPAALLMIEHEIRTKEQKRLSAILAAQRKKAESAKKIKQLANS